MKFYLVTREQIKEILYIGKCNAEWEESEQPQDDVDDVLLQLNIDSYLVPEIRTTTEDGTYVDAIYPEDREENPSTFTPRSKT